MKKSPVNQMSARRRFEMTERARTRQTVMDRARRLCEADLDGCTTHATDVHEIKTRARGGSITDPDNCLALCRWCHAFITAHPAFSDEWGFTVHSWATPEDMEKAKIKRAELRSK